MAEINTAALRARGAERRPRPVRDRPPPRATPGSIRRAAKALARTSRKPSRPRRRTAQWLRDNRSSCPPPRPDDAAAALRHARTLRAAGATNRAARLLRGAAARLRAARSRPRRRRRIWRAFRTCCRSRRRSLRLLVPGLQAADGLRAGGQLCTWTARPRPRSSRRCVRSARPRGAALTERCDRVGRILARDPAGVYPAMEHSHTHPLPADRGAACAAHGPLGDRHRRGRARARAKRRGGAAARGLVSAARGARRTGKAP